VARLGSFAASVDLPEAMRPWSASGMEFLFAPGGITEPIPGEQATIVAATPVGATLAPTQITSTEAISPPAQSGAPYPAGLSLGALWQVVSREHRGLSLPTSIWLLTSLAHRIQGAGNCSAIF